MALILLLLFSCSRPPEAHRPAPPPSAPAAPAPVEPSPLEAPIDLEIALQHRPHEVPEGAPSAIVHVPAGLRPSAPVSLVVFLHGWTGCTRMLAYEGEVPCRDGDPARTGWGLSAVHDRAESATIFVVLQLAWLVRSGAAGRLAEDGFFRAMMEEIVALHLGPALHRTLSVDDVERVTLAAHSAGFESALAILQHGQVEVRDVILFDALYAASPQFAEWAIGGENRRIVSLHTGNGRPERQSVDLARRVRAALGEDAASVDPEGLIAAIGGHRVTVALVRDPHSQVPGRELEVVLRGLGLPAR